MVAPVQNHLNR